MEESLRSMGKVDKWLKIWLYKGREGQFGGGMDWMFVVWLNDEIAKEGCIHKGHDGFSIRRWKKLKIVVA